MLNFAGAVEAGLKQLSRAGLGPRLLEINKILESRVGWAALVGWPRESISKGIVAQTVAWYIHRSSRSDGFPRQLSYDAVHDADNVQHQIRPSPVKISK